MDSKLVLQALLASWSAESCSKYDPANPAKGQCSVTAIVIHERFGGEILKTEVAGRYHFYNRIAGKTWDFTKDQFPGEITYLPLPSSAAEAQTDCTQAQVAVLREKFNGYLSGRE